MSEIRHRTVETNGIHMHIAENGAGPLVVLCHGCPENGIRGAISCMRSQKLDSKRSRQICQATGRRIAQNNSIGYTPLHLVGDVVGLLDALGTETAVIVGHDCILSRACR